MNKDQEIYSHYHIISFLICNPLFILIMFNIQQLFWYIQHSNVNASFIQNSCDFHMYFSFSLEVNEFVLLSIKPKNTNAMK